MKLPILVAIAILCCSSGTSAAEKPGPMWPSAPIAVSPVEGVIEGFWNPSLKATTRWKGERRRGQQHHVARRQNRVAGDLPEHDQRPVPEVERIGDLADEDRNGRGQGAVESVLMLSVSDEQDGAEDGQKRLPAGEAFR